jgi:hypothetical protein
MSPFASLANRDITALNRLLVLEPDFEDVERQFKDLPVRQTHQ